MVHCPKCGASLSPQVRFCDKCGQEQPATSWRQAAVPQSGLSENAAACLSYSLGWITGIIFFFVDHRPYVRFHAAQSIDRKSTRLNSSHVSISYAVFCLKKKKHETVTRMARQTIPQVTPDSEPSNRV